MVGCGDGGGEGGISQSVMWLCGAFCLVYIFTIKNALPLYFFILFIVFYHHLYLSFYYIYSTYLGLPSYLWLPTYLNIPTSTYLPQHTYLNIPTSTDLPQHTYLNIHTNQCLPIYVYLTTSTYLPTYINILTTL